ncbi:SAM-dependent methyltransferase [Clostridia bacterium]|nr:SAM-dependent methyltransferase [Clostridia bacterium]
MKERTLLISKRLQEIATFVSQGNTVIDVGCDHAYLPIFLIQKKISPKVFAFDSRQGPLKQAKEHILDYEVDKQVELRLSDGLEALQGKEGQTVILSGLGRKVIQKIVEDRWTETGHIQEWIFSPQSEWELFYSFLNQYAFVLEDERMIKEKEKYYLIIKAKRRNLYPLRPQKFTYGTILIQRKDKIFQEYLEKKRAELEELEKTISGKSSSTVLIRLNELKAKKQQTQVLIDCISKK